MLDKFVTIVYTNKIWYNQMGGMGEKEYFNMYNFVDVSEVKIYKKFCTDVLTELRDNLNEKHEINTQFYLVGSGASNFVTQNSNEPFDLDYNLRIMNMPQSFYNSLKSLKDIIRNELNLIVGNTLFSDGRDSKSVITSVLHLKSDKKQKDFSFDIAILAENKEGNLCRLINHKALGQFTWSEVPSSYNVRSRADQLKKNGLWNDVRLNYINKKNMYLTRNDYDHPSFVIYVEAVNEVYQRIER